MGLFVCAKCNCIENTALGLFWCHDRPDMYKWTVDNEAFKGKPLCSECMPTEFSDGSGKKGNGKWHGKFPKENYDQWKDGEGGKHYYRHGYELIYIQPYHNIREG